MVDSTIILGIVALLILIMQASIEYFKTSVGAMWLKLIMFFMAGIFNAVNCMVFGGDGFAWAAVLSSFKDGLVLGAAASGIYGMGKDVANSTATVEQLREVAWTPYGFIDKIIPLRRTSLSIMLIGFAVFILSFSGYVIGAIGLVIVLSGYCMGTVSATRSQKRYQYE